MSLAKQFPILKQKINGHPLIYFDNAATSQKPQVVLDSIQNFYTKHNSNVHRSLYPMAERAGKMYENARKTVARFLNALVPEEIIFTRNTTESINLVAKTWGQQNLKKGDRIVLPISEHHSNIVPWLQLSKDIKIHLDFIPLDNKNQMIDLAVAKKMIAHPKTKLFTFSHASNVLGAVLPIKTLISFAKQHKTYTLIDAAQSVAHTPIDVQNLGCDFLAFSGHKCYGPNGIGVLYGKREHLESTKTFLGGGLMIHEVFQDTFTPNEIPYKFEAGTPNVSGAVGLGTAIEWIQKLGWEKIQKIEGDLTKHLYTKLDKLDFVTRFGPRNPAHATPIASFTVEGTHPHDVADLLGMKNICIRAGHHCCMPLHNALKVPATARASLAIYNTKKEIDVFIDELKKVYKKFQ